MDFNKILSDSAVSTLRTLLFTGRRLIVIPLLTKLIDVGSYGFWATTIGLVMLFANFGSLQMSGALIRYTSMESDQEGTFGGTFLLTLIGGTLAAAGFLAFALATGFLNQVNYTGLERDILLVTIATMVFARSLYSYLSNYPRAQNRVKEFEAIQLLELLLEVLAITAVLYMTRSVVWGMIALTAVLLVSDIALLIRYVGTAMSLPTVLRLRTYLTYSVPLVFKGVSSMLLANADKLLILYILSPAAAGIYAAAYNVSGVFRSLGSVLNPTLYPAVSAAWDNQADADLQKLYQGVLIGYTILAVPALVGLTIIAPSLLHILSTETVSDGAVLLVPVIGLGLLFRGYEGPLSYILKADERTMVLGGVVVVAAILNILLNIILIPSINIMGAALATLVSEFLIFAVVFWRAQSLVDFNIPLDITGKTILASGIMAVVLLSLPVEPTGVLYIVLAPPVGAGIYFAVMLFIGGFPDSVITTIRAAVR